MTTTMICESKIDDTVALCTGKVVLVIPSKRNWNGAQFCSVVVITLASHARGPRFEPGQN